MEFDRSSPLQADTTAGVLRIHPFCEALRQSYLDVTEQMERIYTALQELLGYRVRSGLTIRQFTIAAAALAEGCVLRGRVDCAHMHGILRPTGPDGEAQEWTLFGVALNTLTNEFFDLDPTWVPPTVDANSVSDVLNA